MTEAYTSGLEACAKGASSGDKALLARWRTYFLFCLADVRLAADGPEAAQAALSRLDAEELTPTEEALLALCRAVAHLHAGSVESADAQLTACATVLERVIGEGGEEGGEAGAVRVMRAHYFLLFATAAMARGRAAHLRQGEPSDANMHGGDGLAPLFSTHLHL